ncbi:MAG: hypothetical protein K2O60_07320 [Ruminococcus sp.]|nr:hypothetical protein [Ruminococcus sp.]
MKDKKDNLFSRNLNNLDDADVEKISATVPALDKQAKKRILEKCMSRMTETDFEYGNTVSGTEKYSRPHIMHYISTVAACLLAVVGIGGMIFINRNIGTPPDDVQSAAQYTAVTTSGETTNKTISSSESTTVSTVTTAVVNIEEIAETSIKVQQVTESITEITTETPTEIQQFAEPATEITTEAPTEIQQFAESTTETVTEVTTENKSFVGEYGDKYEIDSNSGSRITITKNDNNSYNIYIGFFRVAGFTDCIGSVTDGVLKFYAPKELYGETVFAGEITLNDDGCILKITESENNPIGIDSDGTQYYRMS